MNRVFGSNEAPWGIDAMSAIITGHCREIRGEFRHDSVSIQTGLHGFCSPHHKPMTFLSLTLGQRRR
jgi:hypothetical protein